MDGACALGTNDSAAYAADLSDVIDFHWRSMIE